MNLQVHQIYAYKDIAVKLALNGYKGVGRWGGTNDLYHALDFFRARRAFFKPAIALARTSGR